MLDWAGVEVPAGKLLDGVNLDAVVRSGAEARNSPIGFESQHQLAWTDNRYKLVHVPTQDFRKLRGARRGQNPGAKFEYELYDIVDDPPESTNLATQYPEIVSRMAQELAAWRQSVAKSIEGDEDAARAVLAK